MTRGTWQGSGSFNTGGPDPSVVLAVLIGVLLIGGSGAAVAHAVTGLLVTVAIVAGVLVVAAAVGLVFVWRATKRREAAYAMSDRHQRIMATVAEIKKTQVTQSAPPPAIEQHVHHHHYYPDTQPALRVIRGEVDQ